MIGPTPDMLLAPCTHASTDQSGKGRSLDALHLVACRTCRQQSLSTFTWSARTAPSVRGRCSLDSGSGNLEIVAGPVLFPSSRATGLWSVDTVPAKAPMTLQNHDYSGAIRHGRPSTVIRVPIVRQYGSRSSELLPPPSPTSSPSHALVSRRTRAKAGLTPCIFASLESPVVKYTSAAPMHPISVPRLAFATAV
ncbi:MAG: hypothetical protein L6R42_004457 [Xanthoria sp. 1 TBL-2021]|nr:MAG: hypothetical protein L6R42_004457 [Xanthoria sp. 1 TBL-2021]